MTDIALIFDPLALSADIAIEGGSLATDDGLRTAIIISLFTDRRARADDVLPSPGADRRGWWGDCFNADPNDRIGSRLWLLEREKLIAETALKARDMCIEALAWLIEDGVASTVDVETSIVPVSGRDATGGLLINISISRPDGPGRQRFDFVWDATARSFAAQ
ncbi:MAG: phage GP46 family protein [Sphingomonas sp.]